MRQITKSGKRLLALLLTLVLVAGFIPGGLLLPEKAKAAEIPDAPTREQASVIKFIDAKTNYLGGIALDAAGKVWTWGYNAEGMLGTNSATGAYAGGMMRLPFFVDNNINIVQIEGGYHTNYALDDKGILYAWGKGNEGQMGNGTTTANNPIPKVVSSLTDLNLSIKKIITTTEASSATYVLTTDGKVYAWGYADGYRINGWSGYQRQARHLPEFDDLNIVDIELGNQHGIALDKDGQIYTWGYNTSGQLGHGTTTLSATPKKVEFFNNMTVVNISAEFNTSMAVTSDGRAWKWGTIYEASTTTGSTTSYLRSSGGPLYYRSTGSSRSVRSPELIEFDMTSAPSDLNYGTTAPPVAFVTAGRYASYVTDIYGRVWYFGWNVNYGFATDGPLFTTTNGGKHSVYVTKATLLRTLGDGDTQGYMNNPIAPVFTGFTSTSDFLAQYNSYNRFGQWSQMGDGLHPTIYDKKYMVTSNPSSPALTNDYPLDKDGNRLVYVIKREQASSPYTYGGAFYIASSTYTGSWCVNNSSSSALPVGVTDVKSSPVVKEDERSWIGLVVELDTFDYSGNQLNAMPYISGISTYQSQILFIDNVGNLYKQSLDGSGSIAWGWDYSKYENGTAGNNATRGLYNFYNYEIMYMRGAPNVAFAEVVFEKPVSKIYLVEDEFGNTPTDTVKVTVTVPPAVTDDKLNLTVEPELTELRYVYIPYDETDPNFNLVDFTAADFYAAVDSGLYDTGNLLNPALSYKEGMYSFNFEVKGNGKFWVLTKDLAYTRTQYHTAEYLIDNFYTPVDMKHQGLEFDPPGRQVYEPTDDNIVKTSSDIPATIVLPDSSYYGLPLDANGNVLTNPSLGYDSIRISRYDPLPGDLEKLWAWHTPQDAYVDFTLDNISYLTAYVHDFFYDSKFIPEIDIKDFMKTANPGTFKGNGDVIEYTISFTMPESADIAGYISAKLVDVLPDMGLEYQDIAMLSIDGAAAEAVVMTDSGNTLFLEFNASTNPAFLSLAGKTVALTLTFKVFDWESGPITNTGEIYFLKMTDSDYPDDPAAKDDETIYPPLEINDFAKTAEPGIFYGNGDEIAYTVSFTLPVDLGGYDAARIVDVMPAELVYKTDSATLSIGGAPAVTVTALENDDGNMYYDLTDAQFKAAAGKTVALTLTFTVTNWIDGEIVNTSDLYFRPADADKDGDNDGFPDDPDYTDDETITPPGDIEDFLKKAKPGTFKQNGDVIDYTISFKMPDNLSKYSAAKIVDVLPDIGLHYLGTAMLSIDNAAADAVTMSVVGNTLVYEFTASTDPTFASLAGKKVALTLTFEVSDWISGPITNIGQLFLRPTGGNYPGIPDGKGEETIYPPLVVDDFEKTANPGVFFGNGDEIDYTVSFTMPEDLDGYDGARIVDVMPPELVYKDATARLSIGDDVGTAVLVYANADGNMYFDITGADFADAAGKTISLTLTFTVKDWEDGEITNTAELYFRPADADKDDGNNGFPDVPDYEDEETITPPPDIEDFIKVAKPGTFKGNNDLIDYTISFKMPNNLSKYSAAKIVDVLPAVGLEYLGIATLSIDGAAAEDVSDDVEEVDNTLVYEFTDTMLASLAGKHVALTLSFKVSGWTSGKISNIGQLFLKPKGGDYPKKPNIDIEIDIYPPLIVDDFEKTADPGTFKQNGDIIDYTVSFTMPEDLDGYNAARIVDLLPDELVYEAGTAVLTIGGVETFVVILGTLDRLYCDITGDDFLNAAGKVVELTMSFKIDGWESGDITNTAELYFRPADADPDDGNGGFPDEPAITDDETITKELESDLDYAKSVADADEDGYAAPGEELTYTITIENKGDGAAVDVFVQDTLSLIIAHIDDPNANDVTIGGVVMDAKTVADLIEGFEIPEIAAGAVVTVTFSVTVKADLDTDVVKELRNQATIGPGTPPPPVIIKTKSVLKIAKNVDGMPIVQWAADYEGDIEALLAGVSFRLYKVSGNGAAISGSSIATGTISLDDGYIRFTPSTFEEGWYAVVEVLSGDAADFFEAADIMYVYVGENGAAVSGSGTGSSFDFNATYQVTHQYIPYHTMGVPGLNGGGEVFLINAVAEDGTIYKSFCANDGSYDFSHVGYMTATPLAGYDDVLEALNYINNKYGSIDYWAWDGWPAATDQIQTRLISQVIVWVLYNGVDINAFYEGGMTAFGYHDFYDHIPWYIDAIDDVLANYKGTTGDIIALAYLLCAEDPVNHIASCQPQLIPIFNEGGGGAVEFNNTTLNAPDLVSEKTVSDANKDGYASPGEVLTYTITINNIGGTAAIDTLVQDGFDFIQSYIDAPSGNITIVNDSVTTYRPIADLIAGFEIPSIGAGKTVTVTFTVTVRADLDMEEIVELENIAVVGDYEPPPPVVIETLGVKKISNKSQFTGNGDTIEYEIRFKMPDDISAYDAVRIVDVIPEALEFVGGNVNLYIGGEVNAVTMIPDDGIMYFDLTGADFQDAAGLVVRLTITFKVTGWQSGPIVNKAQLYFRPVDEDFPDDPNVEDELIVGKEPLGILDAIKTVADANGDGYASPGETLTYTITITNSGDAAVENVSVADSLTDMLPYIYPFTGDVTVDNNGSTSSVTFDELMVGINVGDIAAGTTVTVTFSVTVVDNVDIFTVVKLQNIALVQDSEPPSVVIETLGVKKNSSKAQFTGNGDTVDYTISFKMPDDVEGYDAIRIVDIVPTTLEFVDGSAVLNVGDAESSVTMSVGAGTLYFDLDGTDFTDAAGMLVKLTLSFTIKDWEAGSIENKAQLYLRPAGEDYPDDPNDEDTTIISKLPFSELESDKSVTDENGDGYAQPGETLTYTITIVNVGDATAEDVSVQDTLSELMLYIDAPSGSVTVDNGGTIYDVTFAELMDGFNIEEIAAGATVTVTFSVTVIADLDIEDVVVLTNEAIVPGTTPPTTDIETLGVKKNSSKAQFIGNYDTVDYTISFKMPNNVDGYDAIRIVDIVPDILVYNDSAILNIGGDEERNVTMSVGAGTLYFDLDGTEFAGAAGKLVKLTLSFTILGWEAGSIENKAQLYLRPAGEDYPDDPTDEDTTIISKLPFSELESDKSVVDGNYDGYASPGETLYYTITVRNVGDAVAEDVLVQDTLSDMWAYIDDPSDNELDINGATLVGLTVADLIAGFEIPEIPAGAEVTVCFNVTVKADFDFEETVVLTNTAIVADTEPPTEDIETLGVRKTANKTQFTGNFDLVEYTIEFKMPEDISKYDAVRIVDKIPNTLEYVGGSAILVIGSEVNTVTPIPGAGIMYFDLTGSDFQDVAGKIVKLTMTFQVLGWEAGSIINKAELYFREKDKDFPETPNVEDELEIGKKLQPRIINSKEVSDDNGDGYASPGEELTYVITVKNTGDGDAFDVVITDTLADLLEHINDPTATEIDITGAALGTKTVADLIAGITVDKIEPGDEIVLTFTVTVNENLDVSVVKVLVNQLEVSEGDDPPPTEIETRNILTLKKTVDGMLFADWAKYYEGDMEALLAGVKFELYPVDEDDNIIWGTPAAIGSVSPDDGLITFVPPTVLEGWYAVVEVLTGDAADVFKPTETLYIYVTREGVKSTVSKPNIEGNYDIVYTGGYTFDVKVIYDDGTSWDGGIKPDGSGQRLSTERFDTVLPDGRTFPSFCADLGAHQVWGDYLFDSANHNFSDEDLTYLVALLDYLNDEYADVGGIEGQPGRMLANIIIWNMIIRIDNNAGYADDWPVPDDSTAGAKIVKIEGTGLWYTKALSDSVEYILNNTDAIYKAYNDKLAAGPEGRYVSGAIYIVGAGVANGKDGEPAAGTPLAPINQQRQIVVLFSDEMVFKNETKIAKLEISAEVAGAIDPATTFTVEVTGNGYQKTFEVPANSSITIQGPAFIPGMYTVKLVEDDWTAVYYVNGGSPISTESVDTVIIANTATTVRIVCSPE